MTTDTLIPGSGISISCTNGVCTLTVAGSSASNLETLVNDVRITSPTAAISLKGTANSIGIQAAATGSTATITFSMLPGNTQYLQNPATGTWVNTNHGFVGSTMTVTSISNQQVVFAGTNGLLRGATSFLWTGGNLTANQGNFNAALADPATPGNITRYGVYGGGDFGGPFSATSGVAGVYGEIDGASMIINSPFIAGVRGRGLLSGGTGGYFEGTKHAVFAESPNVALYASGQVIVVTSATVAGSGLRVINSITASSMTISSNTYLAAGASFYANAPPQFANGLVLANLASGECVQTTTGGRLTTTGAACGSGGGGGSSALEVIDGVRISSPTNTLDFQSTQFVVTLAASTTAQVAINTSSFTALGPDPSVGGDLSGTLSNAAVGNDSHAHTGSTLSGIDISDDTNLAVSAPITLTGDTIGIDSSSATLLGPSIDLSGAEATGTLAAGRFPALTGDVTTTAGSLATTLAAQIPGAHTFTGSMTVAGAGLSVTYGVAAATGVFTSSLNVSGLLTGTTIQASSATFANLAIPGLTGQSCIGTSASGVVQAGSCSGGAGDNLGSHIATMTVTANYGIVGSTFSFVGPQQSTVTYGLTVGTLTVSGGAGNLSFSNDSGSNFYQVVGSSTNATTGQVAIWSSSWTQIAGGTVVNSIAKSGSSALVGAVTLSQGSNVTLTQTGNDISIASSGGGGGGDSLGSHISTKTITAGYGIDVTTGVFTSTITAPFIVVSTLNVTSSMTITNISNLDFKDSVGILNLKGVETSTLTITGLTSQSCIGTDGSGNVQAGTCGGGGSSTLAVGTGTASGFTGPITSSPTAVFLANQSQINITKQGSATSYMEINTSSFTALGPDPAVAGDVTGTLSAVAVTDDSHAHTGSTLSGIDISADTNLAVSQPIILTNDTLSLNNTFTSSLTVTGAGIISTYGVAAATGVFTSSLSVTGLLAGTTIQMTSGTITNLAFTTIQGVTPALIAGTNITSITGTWPNQTINAATQGGGGGGYAVQPATVSFSLSQGATISSVTVSSNAYIANGTTFYNLSAPQFDFAPILNSLTADRPLRIGSGKQLGTGAINLASANEATGVLPAANLPTTVVYTNDSVQITSAKTFASSTTVDAAMRITGLISGTTMQLSSMTATGGSRFLGNVIISSSVHLNGTPGTNGQVFTSAGPNALPTWETPGAGAGDNLGNGVGSFGVNTSTGGFSSWVRMSSATVDYGVTMATLTVTSSATFSASAITFAETKMLTPGVTIYTNGFTQFGHQTSSVTFSSFSVLGAGSMYLNDANNSHYVAIRSSVAIDTSYDLILASASAPARSMVMVSTLPSTSKTQMVWRPIPEYYMTTASSQTTGSVLSTSTLIMPVLANATYYFDCSLIMLSTTTTTGIGLSMLSPVVSGSTITYAVQIASTAATATVSGGYFVGFSNASDTAITSGGVATREALISKISGIYTSGPNGAGNLVVRFKSELANSTTATMKEGSFCSLLNTGP